MSNDVISRSELIKELRKEHVRAAADWIKYPERLEEVERVLEIVRGIPEIANNRIIILPEGVKPGDRVYEIYRFCGEGAWEVDVHQFRLEDIPRMGRTVFPTMKEAENAIERRKILKGSKDNAQNTIPAEMYRRSPVFTAAACGGGGNAGDEVRERIVRLK